MNENEVGRPEYNGRTRGMLKLSYFLYRRGKWSHTFSRFPTIDQTVMVIVAKLAYTGEGIFLVADGKTGKRMRRNKKMET